MAKKSKKIRYDFFQINNVEDQKNNVHEIFEKKHYKPLIVDGSPIVLFGSIELKHDIYSGILIHNQMNELAPCYDIKVNRLRHLDFTDNEGLASPRCFIFDKKINILMFECGKGISLNRFIEFFEHNSNIDLETNMVIDPEKIKKYNRLDFISKIEVRIAKVKNGELFKGEKSISEIIKLAEDTNSNKIDYTLSSERHGSLNMSYVKNVLHNLTNYFETAEVEKLKVTGREENESHSTYIDLIRNRFRIEEEYDLTRHMDIVFVNSKLARMKKMYMNVREQLLEAYL